MPKLSSFWVYFIAALIVILLSPGCSMQSCTDAEMAAWREQHPNASHSEASSKYRRFQMECKEI